LSRRIRYVCPRCGAVYSVEDYQKSLFCRECGSFLRKKYVVVKQPSRQVQKKAKSGIERFFPYNDFRPFQRDAIDFAFDVIRNRKIGLLSSPCGTGKSISVLTAFFMAKELDESVGRLFALTRTRNQLEIYCRELKRIKEYSGVNFVASIFKSKMGMCPYVWENARLRGISYRGFLQYCRNLKDGAFGNTCEYYERTYKGRKLSWRAYNVVNKIKKVGPLLPDEVYEISVDAGLCPYEVTKVLAKYADIIVGNYNYILVDSVRNSIFGRAGIKVEDVNCVFDEAHSLPYYAAGILSDELSSTSVKRAQREVEAFGVDDFDFLEALYDVLVKLGSKVYGKFGFDVEHVVERREIVKPLLERLRVDADKLLEIISELSELGESIRYKRAERGRNPISYLSRCATFLSDWVGKAGSSYARYVKVEVDRDRRRRVRLGIRCLDPALAASVINELRSAVLMSGTLWHTDYYVDVLGIERSRCESIELPSPFPRENRLIVVDMSVTTKFERRSEAQWKKIADHLERIIGQINGRVAVYFPSYAIMREVAEAANFDLPFILEEKHTKIVDLLRFLKSHKQCVVFGVARGKISEGVDMSMDGRSMLSAVIAVGLPYPKRTELQAVLVRYFREKFGNKAMEYANGIPCLNALAQSAGRLLRSPEDKGIIVMMDGRAAGRFKEKLPKDWREDMKAHYHIEKLSERIKNFTADNAEPSEKKIRI
jgi:DNA excision repair protein ERCC-2